MPATNLVGETQKPKRINARTVSDRKRLNEAFDALPDEEGGNPSDGAKSTNPWDEVAA